MMERVKEFVIRRSIWLRGDGGAASYLMRGDGKMCCIGIYLAACGVPTSELKSTKTAVRLSGYRKSMLHAAGADWLVNGAVGLAVHGQLMEYNDYIATSDVSESAREAAIAEGFASQGVAVTFVDD